MIYCILYILEEKKKRGLSVRSEFGIELRQILMNLIEAIYFIFFLPLSAVDNEEISSHVMLTTQISIFSLVNLLFFSLLFVFKHKSENWKLDIELKGYWVEVKEQQE